MKCERLLKFIFVILMTINVGACVEGGSDSTSASQSSPEDSNISALNTSNLSTVINDYKKSDFSSFIYYPINDEDNKTLVIWTFYGKHDACDTPTYNKETNPEGCQIEKTVSVSCEVQSVKDSDDGLLNINISAGSEETSCENDIVFYFTDSEFTADGIVIPTTTVENFSDLGFKITKNGFINTTDGSTINADPMVEADNANCNDADKMCVGLEQVYDQVIADQTS